MQIKGHHILITGAAKRIGRTIAEHLLAQGAKISAHFYHSEAEAMELEKKSDDVFAFHADLKSRPSIMEGVAEAIDIQGPIDILINSASLFAPKPALEVSEEDWEQMQQVNLRGQFYFCQAVAPHMLHQGRGVILNVADVNGSRALAGYAPYAVSKAGLLHLTRVLAKEWAPTIRVNSISPGPVLFPENYDEAKKRASLDRTLLKREGSPQDIAFAAQFFIENDYLTGIDLPVDGGRNLT